MFKSWISLLSVVEGAKTGMGSSKVDNVMLITMPWGLGPGLVAWTQGYFIKAAGPFPESRHDNWMYFYIICNINYIEAKIIYLC